MEQTALVVPVPRVAALVDPWRSRHDPSAALGVPAHVTIVAPVLSRIGRTELEALEAIAAAAPPTSVELTTVGMFEDAEVLHLRPDTDAPFRALADAVRARFPDAGGNMAPEDYVPHVTVGHRIPRPSARHAARALLLALPVRIPVHTLQLWVARDGEAIPAATFPLGAVAPVGAR